MNVVVPALEVALAAVFAVAGLTKLADPRGTREAAKGFGVPRPLATGVAFLLPLAELAVAFLLVAPGQRPLGPLAALALLSLLSAAVAASLARGRRPDCHCFGALKSEPIGARTLVRNAALAAIAGVLALEPATWSVDLAPGSFAAGFGLAAALAAPLVVVLLRRHGRALTRGDLLAAELGARGIVVDEELGASGVAGLLAPDFRALAGLPAADRPLIAVFTSRGCAACAELEPRLAEWRRRHGGVLDLAELDIAEHEPTAEAAGVSATPAAVMVAPDGHFASEPALGTAAIEELLAAATRRPEERAPLIERLPDMRVRDASGDPVSLLDRLDRERDTVLVLWDPTCGFCGAMAADLEALAGDPAASPVLVVSSASVGETGLDAPVVADSEGELSAALGAPGTPMAVRVAPGGAVIGGIAAGADAVLALGNAPPPLELVQVGGEGAG